MNSKELSEAISSLDVSNIYIYVGDAVRWDYLSERIKSLGVTSKTVASSMNSPPSFSSILTGRLPYNHNVRTFNDVLREDIYTLMDIEEFDTKFINSIFYYATKRHTSAVDPIYSTLNIDPPERQHKVFNSNQNFIYIERGPGGHAPYGKFSGTVKDYFDKIDPTEKKLKKDYNMSIELDVDLFENRLDQLDKAGMIDDTLVIYTSDHGELLGEGGLVGHNAPMHPKLVYVPTVFIHNDLPQATIKNKVFEHINILPLISDLLGLTLPDTKVDGQGLEQPFSRYGISLYQNPYHIFDDRIRLSLDYEGVWGYHGGYTRCLSPWTDRYSILVGQVLNSPNKNYLRKHIYKAIKMYAGGEEEYPDQHVTRDDLDTIPKRSNYEDDGEELDEETLDRLEQLGYR